MKMKKDIKWLKAEVEKQDIVMDKGHIYTDDLIYLIDQLDEPEVLTQEWLDKNVVHIRGLGDILKAEDVESLIVPNQEITYEDAIKVIAENIDTDEFSVGLYIEALNNNEKYEFLTEKWIEDNTSPVDDEGRLYVWKRDLQNVIVSNQELPVVPKYVDVWLTKYREDFDLYPALKELEDNTLGWELTYKWYRTNTHKFVNAYLTGEYKVEEEPLYYALIKGHELLDDSTKYWSHNKHDSEDLFISYDQRDDSPIIVKNTKNRWNELGINDSNADFRKVDEVAE